LNKHLRAVLAALGGMGIAAIVGTIHVASSPKIAVLVDGFSISVTALVAVSIDSSSVSCLFLATRSAEPGHAICLNALTACIRENGVRGHDAGSFAAFDMGLRLGERTGADMAINVLRSSFRGLLVYDFKAGRAEREVIIVPRPKGLTVLLDKGAGGLAFI
jgi:nicotinate-nucleotide--dimethylbenzimidazole phosphoribosyltransferase